MVKGNSLLRKLLSKLIIRVALASLKPRLASWRYQRGRRSLLENLTGKSEHVDIVEEIAVEDYNDEVDEVMEDVIETLLTGLCDRDTTVRWICAKGIGRIASRLDFELADQIVASVIELLEQDVIYGDDGQIDVSGVNDGVWHGACLALAELSRRGLLLPPRLKEVVPWTIVALFFEQRRGHFSIGSHIRDSACFVLWSFARAYNADVLTPFALELSKALLIASITDREIHVRRAAAAAFQENAGRHGLFPHGISVVTTADYFSLGNIGNVYSEIALKLMEFDVYRTDITNHISKFSLIHWDKNMRALAAKSLGLQALKFPETNIVNTLSNVVKLCTSGDFGERHGYLLGVSYITTGLFQSGTIRWGDHISLQDVLLA